MKVNVLPIVRDHLNTLRNNRSGKHSVTDFAFFYGLPIMATFAPLRWPMSLDDEFHTVSITFFGIFIALLLNVQVAVFGIFQRKWDKPEDEHLAEIQKKKLDERRILLGELNANLSYMTLFSCIGLTAFLVFYTFDLPSLVVTGVTYGLFIHFLLTLMMSVKRAHALFQMEYDGHV